MRKEKKKGVFWWILLGLLIAVLLGYVLKKELSRNHIITAKPTQPSTLGGSAGPTTTPSSSTVQPSASPKAKIPVPATAEKEARAFQGKKKVDYCAQLEGDVKDFFSYLDSRPYIQHLELGEPLLEHAKYMVKRLSAHPPVPAGEGIDPRILTRNIYHLYRTLGLKDIRLIREILVNEQDSLEINLDIFYRWLMAGDRCPDRLGLRPSFPVLYRYAGFFINTIGGRASLFRRPNLTRLLVTYYCLLILHKADLQGQNSYGIDIYPAVVSLKNEIAHYHDLEFQSDYLEKLTKMEAYYVEKR